MNSARIQLGGGAENFSCVLCTHIGSIPTFTKLPMPMILVHGGEHTVVKINSTVQFSNRVFKKEQILVSLLESHYRGTHFSRERWCGGSYLVAV